MRWTGHVVRMENSAFKMLTCKHTEKRSLVSLGMEGGRN